MKLRFYPTSAILLASALIALGAREKAAAASEKPQPAAAVEQAVDDTKKSPAVWLIDYEAAKAEALKSGKALLIDFTGSDWCPYCVKLSDEVFSYDSFREGVKDKFVLLKIDLPNDKSKQSATTIQQNAMLAEKYGAETFPLILLADAEGVPFASTSYQPGGSKKYLEHLDSLLLNRNYRDEQFAAAGKTEGPEKAKLLFATVEKMDLGDARTAIFYGDAIKQIKQSDPTDESGYAKKEAAKAQMILIQKTVNEFAAKEDLPGALGFVDKTLSDGGMNPEDTQQVTLLKALVMTELGKYDEAVTLVGEAKKIAPESDGAQNLDKLVNHILERKAKGGAKE